MGELTPTDPQGTTLGVTIGALINPHYFDGPLHYRAGRKMVPYGGGTRDDRLREFHEMNPTPVVALREGAMLRIEGRRARLVGSAGGRVFLRGRPARDVRPGADLSRWLGARP